MFMIQAPQRRLSNGRQSDLSRGLDQMSNGDMVICQQNNQNLSFAIPLASSLHKPEGHPGLSRDGTVPNGQSFLLLGI